MGDSYLRQCDSIVDAQYRREMSLQNRGTSVRLVDVQCDYDGSYAAIQIVEKIVYVNVGHLRKFRN